MVSLSMLLALASTEEVVGSSIAIFIGLSSLAITAMAIGIVASDLQDRVADFEMLQLFSPLHKLRWKHLVR